MNRAALEGLDKASLVELALRQSELIAALEARLSAMEARLDEAERRAVRGSAPFGRAESKRSPSPGHPGRKGGHEGSYRLRPSDKMIDHFIEVALTRCPHCGAVLRAQTDVAVEQTIIDLPPVRPQVTRLVTHRNRCQGCGQSVASGHALQVSAANGAAGTQLGARALALAVSLNKGFGLTLRKSCAVMRELLGLSLSPGGLAQALARTARRLQGEDAALLQALKAEPVLHTDETSWYVGKAGFSLWVLTNRAGTCYRIVPSRSRAQAEALLGDYPGVLVSDCLNIYDDLTPLQHKCYAHHLKAIGTALETAPSAYLDELRLLLIAAMGLKDQIADLPAAQVNRMRQALEVRAARLLASPRTADPLRPDAHLAALEEKLRQRLFKQRDHLFTFLDHPAVPATNNRAERQLRPAVVMRKLSCGNKTEAGARTWQIISSQAATCAQRGIAFTDFLIPRLALAQAP
jgi:transposase